MPNDSNNTAGSDCPSTPCSRSFDELMDALADWRDHYMQKCDPVALTLMRAKFTLKDQHDRIGEILAALERQNREVERLRNTARKFVEDYLNIRWGHDGDCGATRLVNKLDCDIDPLPANVPDETPRTHDHE